MNKKLCKSAHRPSTKCSLARRRHSAQAISTLHDALVLREVSDLRRHRSVCVSTTLSLSSPTRIIPDVYSYLSPTTATQNVLRNSTNILLPHHASPLADRHAPAHTRRTGSTGLTQARQDGLPPSASAICGYDYEGEGVGQSRRGGSALNGEGVAGREEAGSGILGGEEGRAVGGLYVRIQVRRKEDIWEDAMNGNHEGFMGRRRRTRGGIGDDGSMQDYGLLHRRMVRSFHGHF